MGRAASRGLVAAVASLTEGEIGPHTSSREAGLPLPRCRLRRSWHCHPSHGSRRAPHVHLLPGLLVSEAWSQPVSLGVPSFPPGDDLRGVGEASARRLTACCSLAPDELDHGVRRRSPDVHDGDVGRLKVAGGGSSSASPSRVGATRESGWILSAAPCDSQPRPSSRGLALTRGESRPDRLRCPEAQGDGVRHQPPLGLMTPTGDGGGHHAHDPQPVDHRSRRGPGPI